MTLEESYKIFAEEIIQSDTRKRVWDELQEAIDFFRRPTSLLQMIFPGLIEVNAFQTGNRFLIIFLIFLGLITGAFILYILN